MLEPCYGSPIRAVRPPIARGQRTVTHSSNRNRHLVALTPLAFAFAAMSAQAASRVDLHTLNVAHVNHQYAAASSHLGIAAQPSQKHAEMLGLDANSSLHALATSTDSDGTRH